MASEYLKWKYKDVQPDPPAEYTKRQKRQNWWYYHKWHVLIAALLIVLAADLARIVLHIGVTDPDVQVAYVGSTYLPDETAAALEAALSTMVPDGDGDGKTVVQLNQYIFLNEDTDAQLTAVNATKLMIDLDQRYSYLFLLEDPSSFQEDYSVLAHLDGSLPEEGDISANDCCLLWTDCPVLTHLDLGTYTDTQGENCGSQKRLSGLYIGRRGFWTEKTAANPDACQALWEVVTEGAGLPAS